MISFLPMFFTLKTARASALAADVMSVTFYVPYRDIESLAILFETRNVDAFARLEFRFQPRRNGC